VQVLNIFTIFIFRKKLSCCAFYPLPSSSAKPLAEKLVFFMNLPVAPFYVMPPDKAAAIKILLYQLTAGWCKVGYSTPMNVKLSKTPPFTNPPNVSGKASIFMNLPVAPFYVMPPDKAAAIKILLYR
jgi:hypothetical protein